MAITGQPFGSGYELDERVRTGTLGTLWRAHGLGGRACAITILDHALGSQVGAELSHRFWSVRPQWLTLGGPSVAVVKDIVIDGPRRGLVTDWIDGQPLDEALDQYGAMPADDLRQLGAEIADALATIHDAGLTHGNLTTGNVVVNFSGDRPVPRLTGLSDAALLRVHDPDFAAPEVRSGEASTAASDLYSLGMVLASMHAGRLPRPGGADAELLTGPGPVAQQSGELPDAVRQLITQLTERDPARRGTARVAADTLRIGSMRPSEASDATVVLPAPTVPLAMDPSAISAGSPVSAGSPQEPPPGNAEPPRADEPTQPTLAEPQDLAEQREWATAMAKRRRVIVPWLLLLLLPLIGYAAWLGFQQLLKPVSDEAVPPPQPSSASTGPSASASAKPTASASAKPTASSPAASQPTASAKTPASGKPTASASAKPDFPRGVTGCDAQVGADASTTSCEFAVAVSAAAQPIMTNGGRTFTVSATSPLTKQTYTMSCKPSGDFVVCTGGDQAAVYLRV